MTGGAGSFVSSQTLATAAAEYWEKRLQGDPIEATLLGDRRFDDGCPIRAQRRIAAKRCGFGRSPIA